MNKLNIAVITTFVLMLFLILVAAIKIINQRKPAEQEYGILESCTVEVIEKGYYC